MSLPSIFDYLPETAEALLKIAMPQEPAKKKPLALNTDVFKSVVKTTLPHLLGVAVGTGLGFGAMRGLEALERHTGKTLLSNEHARMAIPIMMGLAAMQEVDLRRRKEEIWRSAYEASQNRIKERATEK